jgi:Domain of unknown function (DUF4249)
MKITGRNIVLIFSLALLYSCLERYEPEIPGGSSTFLVVDGVITDAPGPYTVKVSKSISLNGLLSDEIKVKGLNLTIEEENGPAEALVEIDAGIYQTTTMQGVVGSRYRLSFDYQGDQYQSAWEKINSSSSIDSVTYFVETRQTTDKESDITGVQFYIDSQGSSQDAIYYRYEWEETWEIGVTYPSFFDYVGNDQLVITTNPRHTCWKYNSQSTINIATSQGLSENSISGHSLAFITGEEERFVKKYSLLIKQYALGEAEYLFWKTLKESNEQLGSLYDKQPANIRGNIFNLSSPAEIVLGYFSASGLQESRVFIDNLQILSKETVCLVPLDTLRKADLGSRYEELVMAEIEAGKLFYGLISFPTSLDVFGIYLSDPKCSDCQRKRGDVNRPIYWDD